MKPESHAVFERANELRIGRRTRRGQMAGSDFAIHGHESAQCELKSATIAPGADRVSKRGRLRTALEPDSSKGIRHETFAQAGIDRPQH
jgi:hypothetical protein